VQQFYISRFTIGRGVVTLYIGTFSVGTFTDIIVSKGGTNEAINIGPEKVAVGDVDINL